MEEKAGGSRKGEGGETQRIFIVDVQRNVPLNFQVCLGLVSPILDILCDH